MGPSPEHPAFQDPAGIQALLDQIRSSSAWQQLSASHTRPVSSAPELTEQTLEREPPNSSVASLLSQLQSPPDPSPNPTHPDRSSPPASLRSSFPHQDAPPLSGKDLRTADLDEAMPVLLRLAREPSFMDEMNKVSSFPRPGPLFRFFLAAMFR